MDQPLPSPVPGLIWYTPPNIALWRIALQNMAVFSVSIRLVQQRLRQIFRVEID
jgi:hypothetical protein